MIDDEAQSRMQEFVSWARGKGYHVIGALMPIVDTIDDPSPMSIFCTSYSHTDLEGNKRHMVKMAHLLYLTASQGIADKVTTLSLENN
jgi:hypothetical protein